MEDNRQPKGSGSRRTTCYVCGWPLRRAPSTFAASKSGRHYCDAQCRDSDRTRPVRYATPNKGKRLSEWVDGHCETCGDPVSRRVTDTRDHTFCSRDCYHLSEYASRLRAGRRPGATVGATRENAYGYTIEFVGRGDPSADKHGWCLQHRLVMSRVLGRRLLTHENVHHLNGVKTDNSPDNLELWVTSQPRGQRVRDKVAWAHEILTMYADDVDGGRL